LGFKAYARKSSSVEQKRRLLDSGVNMIVVLELHHGQEVIPVVLLFIHKKPEVLV